MGRAEIKGLMIYAFHGVEPAETRDGQEFILNIAYDYNMDAIGISDNIDDGVSYSEVVETVKKYFCAQPYKTLERCAYIISDGLLRTYPTIDSVSVEILKPDAPMRAEFDNVGVMVTRDRNARRGRR